MLADNWRIGTWRILGGRSTSRTLGAACVPPAEVAPRQLKFGRIHTMGAIIYFNFSVYFTTNYKNTCHHVCSFSKHVWDPVVRRARNWPDKAAQAQLTKGEI
jgi:hypothetical protein